MVPALMITPPVNVFTADRVNIPTPVLVNEPVLLMIPEMVALLVPPKMAVPVSVINPEAVPVPLLFTRDPLTINGSDEVNPFKSTEAPDKIVVFPAFVPNAPLTVVAFETPHLMVPALTVVLALYVFAPDNVQVPDPLFVSVPVPLMTPEAVTFPEPPMIAEVERLMIPDVVDAVPLLFTSEPLMTNCSIEANPFKSTKAPNEMVVATADPKPALLPSFRMPALTVVADV
jgi:hypothetical protein